MPHASTLRAAWLNEATGGKGATLPSTLQGIIVKQGVADVCFREAAYFLFPLYVRSQGQSIWNKEQGKFCFTPPIL